MTEHRNTTVTVRMVLKACESAGVDTNELLKLAGIDRETVDHPDGEVTFTQMRDFWYNAFRLSGDPFLGLHTAKHVTIGDYKCLDYLTVHAATVGESMRNFCRYMVLINTWIHWEIIELDDSFALRMTSNAGLIPPHSYEFVFAIYTRRVREISSAAWAPLEVRFPFSSPPDVQPHREFFGCTVQYYVPMGELVISREAWNTPVPNSDQQLLKIMDEHAQMLMAQRPMPDDFVAQVRKEIVRELHGGEAQRDTIAEKLHMSPRTLQRRLEDNGLAFADLLDDVRAELAKINLRASDLSLAEIGFLLGFSEQSSFNRAFKRWTGKTPREYRLAVAL
jgi:AraC-like DNA-binding protein